MEVREISTFELDKIIPVLNQDPIRNIYHLALLNKQIQIKNNLSYFGQYQKNNDELQVCILKYRSSLYVSILKPELTKKAELALVKFLLKSKYRLLRGFVPLQQIINQYPNLITIQKIFSYNFMILKKLENTGKFRIKNSPFQLKFLQNHDIDAYIELHNQIQEFPSSPTIKTLSNLLSMKLGRILGLWDQTTNQLVGAVGTSIESSTHAMINAVMVHPEYYIEGGCWPEYYIEGGVGTVIEI